MIKLIPDDDNYVGRTNTYKTKSCSQHGSAPFTVTVVDLTFCNFTVTYVFNWEAVTEWKEEWTKYNNNDMVNK